MTKNEISFTCRLLVIKVMGMVQMETEVNVEHIFIRLAEVQKLQIID